MSHVWYYVESRATNTLGAVKDISKINIEL